MPSRNSFPFFLLLLLCSTSGYGQDSNIPESVLLMLQRSQEASHYEQMAHMQIEVQYRDFLNSLSGDAQHQLAVENELVAVLSARAELSAKVASGQANASELTAISAASYLRERLAPLLSTAELALLDNRSVKPTANQLKQQYTEQLTRAAPSLTDAERELILDTVVRYLQSADGPATSLQQVSVDDLVAKQLQAMMQAHTELQPKFSGTKLQEMTSFMSWRRPPFLSSTYL